MYRNPSQHTLTMCGRMNTTYISTRYTFKYLLHRNSSLKSTRKVSVRLWWPTCALLPTMLHELLEQGDKGNKLSIGVVVRRCLLIVITQVDMLAVSCLCFVGSSKIFNDVET